MPLKKDASGRRSVTIAVELPGTPEQVWQAMATGPGYSAWFVPTEIEEREGGAIAFHIADGVTSPGRVTLWQPPFRFAYEELGWSGEAPPLATEIVIEAQAGGTCTVRLVHSLFTSKADWDNEIESMENGWPAFFVILRIYLSSFAGMQAASARPTVTFKTSQDAAWHALSDTLGLAGARLGERRETSVNGAPLLAGIVADTRKTPKDRAVTLQLEQPSSGIALNGTYEWGGQVHVAVSLFFYGSDTDTVLARERSKWNDWMERQLRPIIETQAAS